MQTKYDEFDLNGYENPMKTAVSCCLYEHTIENCPYTNWNYYICYRDRSSIYPNDCDIEIINLKTALKIAPNPFNPSTTISFELTKNEEKVDVIIYNLRGQKVKTFCFYETEKGKVVWHGENDCGKNVSSGIYLCAIMVKGKTLMTKKIVMQK